MILTWLIIVLLLCGVLAWFSERFNSTLPRWISLLALTIDLILVLILWDQNASVIQLTNSGPWIEKINVAWIPRLGIHYHLAMDGLSLLLILLTVFLGIMSVITSWTEITERIGFFHFNLLWSLAGVIGVFLALDLFLFFFFWEVMLVPMYFLIAIWGHDNRIYASIKFFLFTQGSGLLMLISILALVFINYYATNSLTFDYFQLLNVSKDVSPNTALLLMLGFFIAFAVKLPAVPFHTWLPDAHTEAPTAGSVILAGVLLKTGAYGLIRFIPPLFPEAAHTFTPVAMALGVIGIIYGGAMAYAQTDLKRLVAYSSVSHLGFVMLGVFAWNAWALQGSVMQMLAHGISTGALFMIVGALQERTHTRDMSHMGGLWADIPRMAAIGLFFAVASLGMPGLGNFVGEFLVLLGSYHVNITLTVVATFGIVIAAVYSLILVQKTFHGQAKDKNRNGWNLTDFSLRETSMMTVMIIVIVWLGVYPQPVFDTVQPALLNLQSYVSNAQAPSRGEK